MQYRTLGKTGWSVSAVSMGCWGIGGQRSMTRLETSGIREKINATISWPNLIRSRRCENYCLTG